MRSFTNVLRINPGFDAHNLVNITVYISWNANHDPKIRLAHVRELLAAFRSIPGVESASVTDHVPLTGDEDISTVSAVGRPPSRRGNGWRGSPYRRGQLFHYYANAASRGSRISRRRAKESAIVNRTMATRLWPGEDAVGRQFRRGMALPSRWSVSSVTFTTGHSRPVPECNLYSPDHLSVCG